MVQKIHPKGVICVPSIPPQVGHLSEKNDDLAIQYEDVHDYIHRYLQGQIECKICADSFLKRLT